MELFSLEAVAGRLALLRGTLGLTQARMSELVGATETGQTWQHYESGRRMIAIHHAVTLCVRFGVTLDWVYRGNINGLPPDLGPKLQADPRNLPDHFHDRRRKRP